MPLNLLLLMELKKNWTALKEEETAALSREN